MHTARPHTQDRAGPLWAAVSHTLTRLGERPSVAKLNEAARALGLTNRAGMALQFDIQTSPYSQRQYEERIYDQGLVATRPDQWHDLFNACMWLTFPQTKAALNAVHVEQAPSVKRTPASDAATLFDESGAILLGPDARLAHWLREHDWHNAFVRHRHLWQSHRLLVIGHAILEKLAAPYPGMIAKVAYEPWPAVAGPLDRPPAGLDARLAARWLAQTWDTPAKLFALPLFGVPGAHPDNEDQRFYDNAAVFRPKRVAHAP